MLLCSKCIPARSEASLPPTRWLSAVDMGKSDYELFMDELAGNRWFDAVCDSALWIYEGN